MGKIKVRRALFPAAYYGANSIYQGYISLYYTHLGLHSGQIGAIGAAAAAASLLAQPLWGRLGDRVRRRRFLLCILSLAAAAALPLALADAALPVQLAAAMLFYAFFCALLPLGDTILLEADDSGFGGYRLVGGISFALVGQAFGVARRYLSPGGALWWVAVLLLLAAGAALLLPDVPHRAAHRGGMFSLLKDKQLAAMLAFILPLQITMGFFYTFYAPHFKQLGGSDALLGFGYLLATASEIPYLIFSGRIYHRFGATKPMCIAAAALALRWLLLGFARKPWIAILSQLLHGGGFIVITVSMALWIGGHVPQDKRAGGQALLNMVTFGLARIAGNLLGGWAADVWGRGPVFLLCAGICLAADGLFVLCARRKVELLSHRGP